MVRKIKISTASEHDTLHFEAVLDPSNTNRNVLADKGYVDGEREDKLTRQGWRMYIQRKGSKDKPIPETPKRRNTRIAKTRARIEHVFAGLAEMGGKGLRTIGLARATLQLIGRSLHTICGAWSTCRRLRSRRSDARSPSGLHKTRLSAHKTGGKRLGLTSKNATAGIATGDYAEITGNSRYPIEVKNSVPGLLGLFVGFFRINLLVDICNM
ncbi:transposase [Massilia mucilaginosa]|uniref:transposase n=1 Tax=Massilia mucilaginosa TaxID=2609282 RepID=UPI001CB720C7|nr:transposase [Massilia mucilaginosa]